MARVVCALRRGFLVSVAMLLFGLEKHSLRWTGMELSLLFGFVRFIAVCVLLNLLKVVARVHPGVLAFCHELLVASLARLAGLYIP